MITRDKLQKEDEKKEKQNCSEQIELKVISNKNAEELQINATHCLRSSYKFNCAKTKEKQTNKETKKNEIKFKKKTTERKTSLQRREKDTTKKNNIGRKVNGQKLMQQGGIKNCDKKQHEDV